MQNEQDLFLIHSHYSAQTQLHSGRHISSILQQLRGHLLPKPNPLPTPTNHTNSLFPQAAPTPFSTNLTDCPSFTNCPSCPQPDHTPPPHPIPEHVQGVVCDKRTVV